MLEASFVRVIGERDRIYVTRSDGSSVSWVFTSYGDDLPHDLVHLVVESAFGVTQGFWGRVDAGADPGAIAREANRKGGRDKYAGYGADQAQLQLAEALANVRWRAADATAGALIEQAAAACRDAGVVPPPALSAERAGQVRRMLGDLTTQWRAFAPKGTIVLRFDPRDPEREFHAQRVRTTPLPSTTSK
jgi:hypothetical protein